NRLGILSIVYNSVYADLQHVYCKDGLSKFRLNEYFIKELNIMGFHYESRMLELTTKNYG
ncbi:hypothetical protein ACFYXY_29360, partial [Paenibacillus lactis]